MEKCAQVRKKKIIEWSDGFAYAVGLLVSDGSLSKDGRHISFSSKDLCQARNLSEALNLTAAPTLYLSGSGNSAYRVQFSDKGLYSFLESIGLMPAKSLVISGINVPDQYFSHYLRGYFDGDGTFYSYFDKRWKSSFMHYVGFVSGSREHLEWLCGKICQHTGVLGRITRHVRSGVFYQLRYAKKTGVTVIEFMYKNKKSMYLARKYLKIRDSLDIVGHTLKV